MPTGLEVMQMMARGDAMPAAMGKLMNMAIEEVSQGRVVFSAIADETHLNPAGGVHGGFAATALDSACGCAVLTTLPEGVGYTTIDLAVKMMRPIPLGETILCTGTVQRPGRTVAFVEASLTMKTGKLLAHATSSCAVFEMANQ